jgi:DNA-binding XRE family transcriptional regulator
MVDARKISHADFRARRILSGHKQASLAKALGVSRSTVQNFEAKKVDSLYSVRWEDLARELGLPQ